MTVAGCGIMPICMHYHKLYILCGIDRKGKVSDLGGRIELNETYKECGVREFYEESVGLLLSYEELMKCKIYKRLKIGNDKYYISLIIGTNYKDIENRYSELISYVKKNNCQRDKNIDFRTYEINDLYTTQKYPYGFFEFEELKWFSLNDLQLGKYPLTYRLKLLLRQL